MSWLKRSAKKKTTNQAGASSSIQKQPFRELNDGMYRRSWKVPSSEEEWAMSGRSFADHPITEEEHADWLYAWESYMNQPPYNEPPRYTDRLVNRDQVMPDNMKASINEANDEIKALGEKWNKNREIQLEKEALIKEKKAELAVLQQEISEEEYTVRDIKEEYDTLEEKINEKAKWIIQCQNIYLH